MQLPDGSKSIPVGKTIAMLAEEGDDISNVEVPKDKAPSSPQQAKEEPKKQAAPEAPPSPPSATHVHIDHSRAIFPSVLRLLQGYNITNASDIKGTGVRGMLTKGDVLAYLGKASGPFGTYKKTEQPKPTPSPAKKAEEKVSDTKYIAVHTKRVTSQTLDGPATRQLIVAGLLAASSRASAPARTSFKFVPYS